MFFTPHQALPAIINARQRPSFRILSGDSGVSNIPQSLTINGIAESPYFLYEGKNADGTELAATVGTDAPITGAGADPTVEASAFTDATQQMICTAKMYGGTDIDDFGTGDIVLLGAFDVPAAAKVLWQKRDGTDAGIVVGIDGSFRLYVLIEDTDTDTATIVSAALVVGARYNFSIYLDRSGSGQIYVNGSASGAAVDISGVNATLANAGNFYIGGDGTTACGVGIDFMAAYESATWLDSHLQADLALDLHQRLTGFYPQIHAGSAVPNTMERDCERYLYTLQDDDSLRLFQVGENWLPVCSRLDDNGDIIKGYAPEIQSTNLITESEDFATTWAATACSVGTDAEDAPDGRTVGDSLIATAVDTQHYLEIAATETVATYTLSVFAKAGAVDWIKLEDVTGSIDAYFDVANKTVGTITGTAQALIDGPYFGDWYRCQIIYTGTAAAHTLRVYAAYADTDDDFTGDGSTPSVYLWGAQCELGDIASSPVITDGATATRLKDELQFVAGANIGGEDVGQGTIAGDWWLPALDSITVSRCFISINDGGSASDRIYMGVNNGFPYRTICLCRASGGTNGDVAGPVPESPPNGKIHSITSTYQKDNLSIFDASTQGTIDTIVDIPDDLDRLNIGMFFASGAQFAGGIISDLRIYPRVVTP